MGDFFFFFFFFFFLCAGGRCKEFNSPVRMLFALCLGKESRVLLPILAPSSGRQPSGMKSAANVQAFYMRV